MKAAAKEEKRALGPRWVLDITNLFVGREKNLKERKKLMNCILFIFKPTCVNLGVNLVEVNGIFQRDV